jgi:prolyl 4-hydroxylase
VVLTPDCDALKRIGRTVRGRLAANPAVQAIATERAEIWGVPGFFSPTECAQLVSFIDMVARPSASFPAGDVAGVRTSSTGALDPTHPVIAALEARIDDLLGLDPRSGELLQGQRYTAGQQFKVHTDWFDPSMPEWEREKGMGGQRAVTAMVYLNPVAEGGETDFPHLDIAIQPGAGTLIAWNNADRDGAPNPLTAHAGNPVIRGAKYIVTKWYRCRAFR